MNNRSKHDLFFSLCLIFTLVVIYVIFEWLFFVTKPSFLSSFHPFERIFIAINTPVIPFLIIALIHITLVLMGLKILKTKRLLPLIYSLAPAFLASCLLFIMIDVFTYTTWNMGINSSSGIRRLLYMPLFLLAFAYLLKTLARMMKNPFVKMTHAQYAKILVFVLCIFLFCIFLKPFFTKVSGLGIRANQPKAQLPNILLFMPDGLEANHLSAYRYFKNTTPFLKEFSKEALVYQNAFSNAGKSTGSVTALLTGKLPTQTKVIFPPQVLTGNEAYQHLPGILKQLGYVNFQQSLRYYADSVDTNLINSFDHANDRTIKTFGISHKGLKYRIYFSGEIILINRIIERITDRLKHVFFIKDMPNFYQAVTFPKELRQFSDEERVEKTINFIKNTRSPWFAHVHLMSSHCCMYQPKIRRFSSGKEMSGKTRNDFYDDIILENDRHFAKIIKFLKQSKILEHTIVIYTSDHNQFWQVKDRIPLIIRFPDKKYRGSVHQNVQLIDVAPTLLSYLGLHQPQWMHGKPMLKNIDTTENRFVFSVADVKRHTHYIGHNKVSKLVDAGPPYYGIKHLNLIFCNRWYELDIRSNQMTSGYIKGHTGHCRLDLQGLWRKANSALLDHLKNNQIAIGNP